MGKCEIKNFGIFVNTDIKNRLIYSIKTILDNDGKVIEIKMIYNEIGDSLIVKNDVYLYGVMKSSSGIIFDDFSFNYGVKFLDKFIEFIEEEGGEGELIEKEFVFKDFYFKNGPGENFEIGKNYNNKLMKIKFTIINYELFEDYDYESKFFELVFGLKKLRERFVKEKAEEIEKLKNKNNEFISMLIAGGKVSIIDVETNSKMRRYLSFNILEKGINSRDEDTEVDCDFSSSVMIPLNEINFSLSQNTFDEEEGSVYGFITARNDYYSVSYEDKDKFKKFIKEAMYLAETE